MRRRRSSAWVRRTGRCSSRRVVDWRGRVCFQEVEGRKKGRRISGTRLGGRLDSTSFEAFSGADLHATLCGLDFPAMINTVWPSPPADAAQRIQRAERSLRAFTPLRGYRYGHQCTNAWFGSEGRSYSSLPWESLDPQRIGKSERHDPVCDNECVVYSYSQPIPSCRLSKPALP